jgi:hypothetical protein
MSRPFCARFPESAATPTSKKGVKAPALLFDFGERSHATKDAAIIPL